MNSAAVTVALIDLKVKLQPSSDRGELLPTTDYQTCIQTIDTFNSANLSSPSKTSTTDLNDRVTNYKALAIEVDDLKRYFNELGEADFKNSCDSDGFWKDSPSLCEAIAADGGEE